jgi:hypothetical protein
LFCNSTDTIRNDFVVCALVAEEFAGFGDLVAVVEVFNGLLEADGNEKAEDDGGDVDEEVAPLVAA